ncbi:ribosomal protein S5 domain 2-type protein [Lipomyces oligophaga]|uniref:ribosomal protein S5 domain 2-type protein n=1 Tax=Lipomyces oligophaga TaxID=45792 RepID=UPI0034CDE6B6
MVDGLCFSAPGKAMFAGGYLVLYEENPSFVTALSARIYTLTKAIVSDAPFPEVIVKSPQFLEGEWVYRLDQSKDSQFIRPIPVALDRKNPFVYSAIGVVLNYLGGSRALHSTLRSLEIMVLSDNAYHSQPSDSAPRFNSHSKRIVEVPKTGLGSSAALTTSICAALLSFYSNEAIDFKTDESKEFLHKIAQTAHCTAQGKVGSGFDVACAVFGSTVYHRFSPSLITQIPSLPELGASLADQENYLSILGDTIDCDWKASHLPCTIPPRLRLLMGDVAGGSETPAMVQLVQKWLKGGGQEAEETWKSLGRANRSLIECLRELDQQAIRNPAKYDLFIDLIVRRNAGGTEICKLGSENGEIGNLFADLIRSIDDIRSNLQHMSAGSGAQIEPETQTELLDACKAVGGVLGGVVPGAGGYDAICLIVVEALAENVRGQTLGPFERVKWLDLREEPVGVREEDYSKVAAYL